MADIGRERMKEKPDFRLFSESDLADLEQMVFGLYEEDPCGKTITSEKIQRTVRVWYDAPTRLILK